VIYKYNENIANVASTSRNVDSTLIVNISTTLKQY